MKCPICNNDIKCGGLSPHLKNHNLTLNEFIKTSEYYDFYIKYKEVNKEIFKAVDFFTELNKPLVEFCGSADEIYDLDHIYSKKEGFRNKIAPEIIGSVINLRYMPASENRSKKSRCDMTKEELLTKYYGYINKE